MSVNISVYVRDMLIFEWKSRVARFVGQFCRKNYILEKCTEGKESIR